MNPGSLSALRKEKVQITSTTLPNAYAIFGKKLYEIPSQVFSPDQRSVIEPLTKQLNSLVATFAQQTNASQTVDPSKPASEWADGNTMAKATEAQIKKKYTQLGKLAFNEDIHPADCEAECLAVRALTSRLTELDRRIKLLQPREAAPAHRHKPIVSRVAGQSAVLSEQVADAGSAVLFSSPVVCTLAVLFPPLGLFLIWKHPTWGKFSKIRWASISAVCLLSLMMIGTTKKIVGNAIHLADFTVRSAGSALYDIAADNGIIVRPEDKPVWLAGSATPWKYEPIIDFSDAEPEQPKDPQNAQTPAGPTEPGNAPASQPKPRSSKQSKSLIAQNSLSGWRQSDATAPMAWDVRDGVIIATATGGAKANLITESSFGDFDLHIEFSLPERCNSGIYLRGCYEIELIDPLWREGKGLADVVQTGAIAGQQAPSQNIYSGSNRWNTMDVSLIGKQISIVLNGVQVLDDYQLTTPTWGAIRDKNAVSGPLILASTAHMKGAKFRNIRISPLGKADAATQSADVTSRPQKSSGTPPSFSLIQKNSLAGWAAADGQPLKWQVRDGVLSTSNGGADIVSEKSFEDFDFHCEFKLSPRSNSGIYFRGQYEIQLLDSLWRGRNGAKANPEQTLGAVYGQKAPLRDAYYGPDSWNVLDVKLVGQQISVVLNNVRIIDNHRLSQPTPGARPRQDRDSGPILIQAVKEGTASFRKMRVTPLRAPGKSAVSQTIDVLPLLDIGRATKQGRWSRDDRGLLSLAGKGGNRSPKNRQITLPIKPDRSYELRLTVERLEAGLGINVGLVIGGRRSILVIDGSSSHKACLEDINGQSIHDAANPTVYKGSLLPLSQPREVVCTVAGNSVSVTCGKRQIIDWSGDPTALTVPEMWQLPSGGLSLGGQQRFRFSEVTYTPL